MNQQTVAPPVLSTRDAGLVVLTLNRAESRNPLSESMMRALQVALDETAEDASARVIVIAAHGPVFSAGHDLKELTAHRAGGDRGLARYREIFAQ